MMEVENLPTCKVEVSCLEEEPIDIIDIDISDALTKDDDVIYISDSEIPNVNHNRPMNDNNHDIEENEEKNIENDTVTVTQQIKQGNELRKANSIPNIRKRSLRSNAKKNDKEVSSQKNDGSDISDKELKESLSGYCEICKRTYSSTPKNPVTICIDCVKPLRFRCIKCKKSYRTLGILKSHLERCDAISAESIT